jgi:pantoate--beta-alanine ligase
VEDLSLPIEIRMCPIVREPDGLALSSRNRYLSPAERLQATGLSRALAAGQRLISAGQRSGPAVRDAMREVLHEAGISRIDYVAVVDPRTLAELAIVGEQAALLIAAFVGETRLIDNCLIG